MNPRRKCLDCRRAALPERSRCEAHYRALMARVLGRSAEFPVESLR